MLTGIRARAVLVTAVAALGAVSIGAVVVGAGPRYGLNVVTVDDGDARISGPEIEAEISLSRRVRAAAVSPGGDMVALASGRPIRVAMGGVRGDLTVVDVTSGETLLTTGFGDAILTGVAYAPRGNRIAFVKDYEELWLLDVTTERLRRLVDVTKPPMRGAVVFDPAFSPSGKSVFVGVVEDTFHGEDDKLDNLWKVMLDGSVHRLTDQDAPSGPRSKVLRGPVPRPGGSALVTLGDPAARMWRAAVVTPDGRLKEVGPVPPLTSAVGATEDGILFMSPSAEGSAFDLYLHEADVSSPSWQSWCEDGCELIRSNVDYAGVQTAVSAQPEE